VQSILSELLIVRTKTHQLKPGTASASCRLYYKNKVIVMYNNSTIALIVLSIMIINVMPQFGASLTYSRLIIYNRNMFMVQPTGE
jgi:hypothetical protein